MADTGDTYEGNIGIGLGLESIVSDVEGHFGIGAVLATNIVIDVRDQLGNPVKRNTVYKLYITETNNAQSIETIIHDPAVPYQQVLPEGAVVRLVLIDSPIYKNFEYTFVIGVVAIVRVVFLFNQIYARITKKRYL